MTPVPAESVTVEQYLRAECHRHEARVAVSFLRANVPDLHHLTNFKSSLSRLFGPAAHIFENIRFGAAGNQSGHVYVFAAGKVGAIVKSIEGRLESCQARSASGAGQKCVIAAKEALTRNQ